MAASQTVMRGGHCLRQLAGVDIVAGGRFS